MTTTTTRRPPPSTLPEWLQRHRKGFLVAELDEGLRLVKARRFLKLRKALLTADRVKNAWGVLVAVIDLKDHAVLYQFHHLGSITTADLEEALG